MLNPFGLYLHIPFCRKKCAYCDFYSAAVTKEMETAYINRLKQEIKQWGGRTDRPIDTLYFGGGTPSLLDTDQIKSIIETVYSSFTVLENTEITLEINPDGVDRYYIFRLKDTGVNRLSIGLQSADDTLLATLSRTHSENDATKVFCWAREAGFNNISVDIMLGVPGCSTETLSKNIQWIKEHSPEHISAYMLILEEKTAFYRNRDKYDFPSDDAVSDEYLQFCGALESLGYEHYEISNFCKKGKKSRHNTKYWLDEEYLGLGPSAYSYFSGKRFHFSRDLRGFIKNPIPIYDEQGGTSEEYIMLALRLKQGLIKKELEKRYFITFSDKFMRRAKLYEKQGFCVFDGETLYFTDKGMLVSNTLICEFTQEEFYENI